jgi:hypothetical protein
LAKRITKTTTYEYDKEGRLTKTTETLFEEDVFQTTIPQVIPTVPIYPVYPLPVQYQYEITCGCGGEK